MSTTDEREWRRTSPLAALFFVGQVLKNLGQNAAQGIAPLAAVFFATQGDATSRIVTAVVVGAALVIVSAILRYWFFRYSIGDDSVLVRDGVFRKKRLDIRFDRVQAINTTQNPVYRWFGLVNVHFDTAGSGGDEGSLPAVEAAVAETLRTRARTRERTGGRPQATDVPAADVETLQPRLQLSNSDMVRIGLSDWRALVLFAFVGPLMEDFGDRIDAVIDSYADAAAEQMAALGSAAVVAAAIVVVLSLALMFAVASVAIAFLRFHRYQLFVDDGSLLSRAGLLTRREQSLEQDKIQSARAGQGLLLRMFGRYQLSLRKASSGGKQKANRQFQVPLLQPDQLTALLDELFAEDAADLEFEPESPAFRRVSPYFIRSRTLVFGVLPACALPLYLWQAVGSSALWSFAAVPVAALIFFLVWRRLGVQPGRDALVRRSGLLGRRITVFAYRRVQRVSVVQTPLHRRRNLANVTIFLAAGSIRIPYVDANFARELRDYLLYKVESSQRSWH